MTFSQVVIKVLIKSKTKFSVQFVSVARMSEQVMMNQI